MNQVQNSPYSPLPVKRRAHHRPKIGILELSRSIWKILVIIKDNWLAKLHNFAGKALIGFEGRAGVIFAQIIADNRF